MKKNNQMKPDNVAKRLWAFFIVLTMCITVQPVVPVKAQDTVQTAARTIYTEFKDGNSTHSGDGSYGNPTIYLRMPMRLPAMGMKSQFWEVVLFKCRGCGTVYF